MLRQGAWCGGVEVGGEEDDEPMWIVKSGGFADKRTGMREEVGGVCSCLEHKCCMMWPPPTPSPPCTPPPLTPLTPCQVNLERDAEVTAAIQKFSDLQEELQVSEVDWQGGRGCRGGGAAAA